MTENLLLEQYGRYKRLALAKSPYRCLLDTDIEMNPHQINAFCAAIEAIKTGGIVLADEVGLGKTIEAGLVLKYVLDSGAKRILIVLPATLRKQWEIELDEKFGLKSTILDRPSVERDYRSTKRWIENSAETRIILTSYDYSSKLMKRFPSVKWDFLIIDEAHNLRNVFHGTKRAKRLYDMTTGIPKILLTATPIQNSLTDIHGLISYIDPRIFGSEAMFNKRYVSTQDYDGLKRELIPVLHRTLRKDVGKYMDFKKRECRTVDFKLTQDEIELYMRVNAFLQRSVLYSIPTQNKGLITLVIRKLLASSSFALIETFEVLASRLEKLKEGTRSADAQEGFDLFWEYVEDEIDENDFDAADDDEEIILQRQSIQDELDEVKQIIEVAERITKNAKITALRKALKIAFDYQDEHGIPQKVVVFTESKRTQKYIASELRNSEYTEDDILLFNGDFNDAMTKDIYRAWQVKNFGKTNYGRSVEYKHAIVDYFKDNARILIVTDAGSEGLNLQFCNTVINYDLPWNPQKIEQRIGRCHRYGQKYDVVAINLLNTENEADRRVYQILSRKFELFEGVFGASDVSLGVLESGFSFEKMILEIYQNCNSSQEFRQAFDNLERSLDSRRDKKAAQLRSILLTESTTAKGAALEKTRLEIDKYLKEEQYWAGIDKPDIDGNTQFWRIDNWGEACFGAHGTLFIGAFCNGAKLLFPVMLVCDENGNHVDFTEDEILHALEQSDDSDIHYFTPTPQEKVRYSQIYEQLIDELHARYEASVVPVKSYNRHKVENWAEIQSDQLNLEMDELSESMRALYIQSAAAKDFLEKMDIRKKAEEKKKQLQHFQETFHKRVSAIQEEAESEIANFDASLKINPILAINIVLKF